MSHGPLKFPSNHIHNSCISLIMWSHELSQESPPYFCSVHWSVLPRGHHSCKRGSAELPHLLGTFPSFRLSSFRKGGPGLGVPELRGWQKLAWETGGSHRGEADMQPGPPLLLLSMRKIQSCPDGLGPENSKSPRDTASRSNCSSGKLEMEANCIISLN